MFNSLDSRDILRGPHTVHCRISDKRNTSLSVPFVIPKCVKVNRIFNYSVLRDYLQSIADLVQNTQFETEEQEKLF